MPYGTVGNDLGFGFAVTAGPSVEPVSRTEAKNALRLAVAVTADDTRIDNLITSARIWAEQYTHRQFITATIVLAMDGFPGRWDSLYSGVTVSGDYRNARESHEIRLPRPPLISLTSVTYLDLAGARQTLDSSQYVVSSKRSPGVIRPAYAVPWPAHRRQLESVLVTYQAGYGASASYVPESIRQAILLRMRFDYDGNEDDEKAAMNLLKPYALGVFN